MAQPPKTLSVRLCVFDCQERKYYLLTFLQSKEQMKDRANVAKYGQDVVVVNGDLFIQNTRNSEPFSRVEQRTIILSESVRQDAVTVRTYTLRIISCHRQRYSQKTTLYKPSSS